MKKRKKTGIFFLMGMLLVLLLTGCGGRDEESLENELAYRKLGIQALNQGNYEEAVTMFQKALDQSMAVIEELEIDICYYKAAAQFKNADIEGALATYTALIEYDKKNPEPYYLRGTLYLQQGQSEAAVSDYKAALERNAAEGSFYNRIGENLTKAGLTEDATAILTEGLQVKGEEPENYREKGRTYFLLGEYDNARTYLDKAINMGDKEAIFYLANMYEAQGETQQANQLYENYVSENSEDTETLNSLGCAQMAEGNYDQALYFFRMALTNDTLSNDQEVRRNEIVALEYKLDFAQARERMESYIADYPEDEEALREYEFLKSR